MIARALCALGLHRWYPNRCNGGGLGLSIQVSYTDCQRCGVVKIWSR